MDMITDVVWFPVGQVGVEIVPAATGFCCLFCSVLFCLPKVVGNEVEKVV